MENLKTIAKGLSITFSALIGAAVCLVFMQDLWAAGPKGSMSAFGRYAVMASDLAASLAAGALSGWLAHFCTWHCLTSLLPKGRAAQRAKQVVQGIRSRRSNKAITPGPWPPEARAIESPKASRLQ